MISRKIQILLTAGWTVALVLVSYMALVRGYEITLRAALAGIFFGAVPSLIDYYDRNTSPSKWLYVAVLIVFLFVINPLELVFFFVVTAATGIVATNALVVTDRLRGTASEI